MKKLLMSLLVLAGIGFCFPAQPTIYGYSGILTAPTAETIKPAGVALIGSTSEDLNTIGGSIGLMPNWEISAVRIDNRKSHTLLHGKIVLLQESLTLPAFAVGVADLTDEIGNSIYAVATKTISLAGTASKTAGLPFGSPQLSLGIASGDFLDGVFAGLVLPVSQKSRLMMEYANDKVNLGLGTQVFPLTELEVFFLDGNLSAAIYFKLGF